MGSEDATTTDFEFCCPACAESLTVNEPMKVALVSYGCVICGASITEDAFAETSSIESG